jgi:hypothetical protein
MIRKEAYVHSAVMDELRRIIEDSEIMAEVCVFNFIYLFKTLYAYTYTVYTGKLVAFPPGINFTVSPLFLTAGTNL